MNDFIEFDWCSKLLRAAEIKNALLDEESKKIFNARLGYMATQDMQSYMKTIRDVNKVWRCTELEEKLQDKDKKLILYGCGADGMENKKILDLCHVPLSAWCDKEKEGDTVDGIKVISVKECCEKHRDAIIIVGSRKYKDEMYDILQKGSFPLENILIPKHGLLVAVCGNQYFDVFSSVENEIFIDAGSYDGNTMLKYIKWGGGNHKKAYCMEIQRDMIEVIEHKIKENSIVNVCIENKAAWNKEGDLYFTEDGAGSGVRGTQGKTKVKAVKIDSMVGDDKVTFIKMDIEGAELEALEGAASTIRKCHPRLAICIYHKPEDVILIADYILSLNPDYKFIIRHYASNMWETVLYAVDSKNK